MTKTKKRANLIPFVVVLGVGYAITAIAALQMENDLVIYLLAGVTLIIGITTFVLTNRKKPR